MDNNDYEEEIEIDSSNGYSFPGFGTGNYHKENNVDVNNSEQNLIGQNQNSISSPSQGNIQSSSTGNSELPGNSSNNMQSGNKTPPSNTGNDISSGNNKNQSSNKENNSNKTQNNQQSGEKNSNAGNNTKTDNNKGLKSGNSSENSGANQNKHSNINNGSGRNFGNSIKNFGSKIFNSASNGAKNMENSLQGDDAPENSDVKDTLGGIGKAFGNIGNMLLLIAGSKFVLIAGLIAIIAIVVSIFGSTFISIFQGALVGGTKFTGWQCNMYSPVSNSNPGEISSFYTWRIFNGGPDAHTGLDISYGSKGEEILATHDGVVVETNYEVDGATGEPFGVYIKVEDPNETDDEKIYRTYYAHICSLEDERELKASCEAGEYKGCDNNCREITKEDGTIEYEYIWSCGESEKEFEDLIARLQVGAIVQKNDVLGYVSDTGSRSAACDFHLHYETQADDLNDNPDEGFIPESPNRFFNIEKESTGCDPILNNNYDPPTIHDIIAWECEIHELVVEPDDDEILNDEVFNYCDETEPITPEEYRYKGDINIKLSQSTLEEEYVYEDGLGDYSGQICNYTANPDYIGTHAQCAAGVHDYFESILKGKDNETWSRFQQIKGNAKDYWYNNARLGTNGFATSNTPSAGSVWVSENGKYGHVMVITEVDGNSLTAYECNKCGDNGSLSCNRCQYRTYTTSELANYPGFLGYINIINEEDC